MKLAELFAEIKKLKPSDQSRLRDFLTDNITSFSANVPVFHEVAERKNQSGYRCVHCQSKEVVRFGSYSVKNGHDDLKRQRYRCKYCKKTFTDVTNTPIARTHKPQKWLAFIKCMLEGYSLRKTAELIQGVHYVTLFYWRHKVLSVLARMDFEQFSGIIEMDETYFLYSEKGKRNLERSPRKRGGVSQYRGISREQVCVLVARDRNKNTYSKVVGLGRILKVQLEQSIDSKITSENILCTDAWRTFSSYAKDKNVKHYPFKSKSLQRTKGIYHIQNVNSYHSRLKSWILKFNGVATKYLNHYLGWFRFLDIVRHRSDDTAISRMIVDCCLLSTHETYTTLRLTSAS